MLVFSSLRESFQLEPGKLSHIPVREELGVVRRVRNFVTSACDVNSLFSFHRCNFISDRNNHCRLMECDEKQAYAVSQQLLASPRYMDS